jgi:cell surface protein SprA
LGSDYKSNYYEYDIPLTLTPAGTYSQNDTQARKAVWPDDNMLDIDLSIFTALKKARNKAKAMGTASFSYLFSNYDENHPNNKVSMIGNPSLGEVKTMIIGVRNNAATAKSGEVWGQRTQTARL